MLAVLLGEDSVFFTPRKTVSGLVYLRQRYLSVFSGAVEFDPYFISHPHSKTGKASVLDGFVYKPTRNALYSANACWWVKLYAVLHSCSASEKSEHSALWLTMI